MTKSLLSLLPIRYTFVIFVVSVFTGINHLNAQVLNDTATLRQVKATVDQIYNMRFSEAVETWSKINTKYPEHPVVFLLKGMIIYWGNYPLLSDSGTHSDFEEQMYLCLEKSENFDPENEAEFLLTSLCARGSLLAFYTGNGLQSRVNSLGRTSYRYLRRSFAFAGTFPDFYFFTGMYNYYREAYPDAHPVYKPLAALFPRGNKEKGMNELHKAYKESIFLKAEAATFLSSNYKFFENDFKNASAFSKAIYREYPGNTVYIVNCIEDLLLTGKYNEAERLINSPAAKTYNDYYQAQFTILRGVLFEKKYNDMNRAQQEYLKGAEAIAEYNNYGEQYAAYAYFGLSRISGYNNDRHNERIYHRKALDLTGFGNVDFGKEQQQ